MGVSRRLPFRRSSNPLRGESKDVSLGKYCFPVCLLRLMSLSSTKLHQECVLICSLLACFKLSYVSVFMNSSGPEEKHAGSVAVQGELYFISCAHLSVFCICELIRCGGVCVESHMIKQYSPPFVTEFSRLPLTFPLSTSTGG